ncbi:hypothetical protein HPP92_027322, partial [Vanilla planifolia]
QEMDYNLAALKLFCGQLKMRSMFLPLRLPCRLVIHPASEAWFAVAPFKSTSFVGYRLDEHFLLRGVLVSGNWTEKDGFF